MNSKLDQNNHIKMKWKKTLFDSLETENSYLNVENLIENLNSIELIKLYVSNCSCINTLLYTTYCFYLSSVL